MDNCRIPFNRVGALPAPTGLPAPKLYLLWGPNTGTVAMTGDAESSPALLPRYSFTPLGQDWRNWSATGWEDCEVGAGVFEATGPDGKRYRWPVFFSHDGDPRREFWGATFEQPSALPEPQAPGPWRLLGLG